MKAIKKGDVINWKGFEVVVIETGIDYGNDKEWATIEPAGNYGFPIDIYLDKYDMEVAK